MAYKTIEDTIGNTPLVQLMRLPGRGAAARNNVILGKLEGNNPAGSVKDRAAMSMLHGAEARGQIKPGDTMIEATSGNTGIALADGGRDPRLQDGAGHAGQPVASSAARAWRRTAPRSS